MQENFAHKLKLDAAFQLLQNNPSPTTILPQGESQGHIIHTWSAASKGVLFVCWYTASELGTVSKPLILRRFQCKPGPANQLHMHRSGLATFIAHQAETPAPQVPSLVGLGAGIQMECKIICPMSASFMRAASFARRWPPMYQPLDAIANGFWLSALCCS